MTNKNNKAQIILPDGQKIDLNIYKASIGEDVIDISPLLKKANMFTYDPGYVSTASCESKITYINGGEGILRHRGYAIEELTKKASFLEVAYMIIFGDLPTKEQYEKFDADIKSHSMVNEEMKNIIDGFPVGAHPMGILSSLTSALTAFNPEFEIREDTDVSNLGNAHEFDEIMNDEDRNKTELDLNKNGIQSGL